MVLCSGKSGLGLRPFRRLIFFLCAAVFLSRGGAFPAGAAIFQGGTGSEEEPYQISSVEELQAAGNELSAHFVLTGNIDASETSRWNELTYRGAWEEDAAYKENDLVSLGENGKRYYCVYDNTGIEPGKDEISKIYWIETGLEGGDCLGFEPIGSPDDCFSGFFDGKGHVIEGLYVNRGSADYVGLFGYAGADAGIKNLGLEDVHVAGGSHSGGLAGLSRGFVSGVFTSGRVSGKFFTGGLAGTNEGVLLDAYSSCHVSGEAFTGGLAGINEGLISNTYSKGYVSSDYESGGLVGVNYQTVSDSFYDRTMSGHADTGKGHPATTAEMQDIETYTSTETEGLDNAWDIVEIGVYEDEAWFIDSGADFPRLGWQYEFLPPGPLPPEDFNVAPCETGDNSNIASWSPSESPDVAGYNLYVNTGEGFETGASEEEEGCELRFWLVEAFGPGDFEHAHEDLSPDFKYYYVMTSVDDEGTESGMTTPIKWSAPGSGETGALDPIEWGPYRIIEAPGEEGSSVCFIATVAYGSPEEPEVRVLRAFRDEFLAGSAPGRIFVRVYYSAGGRAAEIIKRNRALRFAARLHIAPVAMVAGILLNAN